MRVSTCRKLPRGLIVSCQALEDEPLHGPIHMAAMARAAMIGGAVAIRANGPKDVKAIREVSDLPIIGLYKLWFPGFEVYITPTFQAARAVVDAGADIVAIDATLRPRPDGLSARELIHKIHKELRVRIIADISTFEEGVNAAEAGADFVSTTLAGYTPYSRRTEGPDFELVKELSQVLKIPVIAEGRVRTPEEARRAIKLGAYGVVVGGAITRPQNITRRFAQAVELEIKLDDKHKEKYVIGVDIGGTKIRAGLIAPNGRVSARAETTTNATGGLRSISTNLALCLRKLLDEQPNISPIAIGIASAGQVDFRNGTVISATPNLPGWQGVSIPDLVLNSLKRVSPDWLVSLEKVLKEVPGEGVKELPAIFVENDANAAALGEHALGAGRGCNDIVCLTIGTGVGGGVITGGQLLRGAIGGAGELGHMSIDFNGPVCNCGNRGCIEAYISGWAIAKKAREMLKSYTEGADIKEVRSKDHGSLLRPTSGHSLETLTAIEVLDSARKGDPLALEIVEQMGRALGYALVNIVNIFQPQKIVLGGSIGGCAELFVGYARDILQSYALTFKASPVEIVKARLGNDAGVIGAGVLAWSGVGTAITPISQVDSSV